MMKGTVRAGLLLLCVGLAVRGWAQADPPVIVAELPAPAVPKVYSLAANDYIEVKVFQEPDLDTRVRLSENGTVRLPLLGPINIGGKTTEQAANLIRDEYERDYLVNPRVIVTVIEYSKRRFTVLGQVQKQGTYEVSAGETVNLLQALAMAGGATGKGNLNKVTVLRAVEGKPSLLFVLDANAMARNQNTTQFEVLAGDTIQVPEKVF